MKLILIVSAVLLSLWSGSLSAKGKPVPQEGSDSTAEGLDSSSGDGGTLPSPTSGSSGLSVGSATCSAAKKQQLDTKMAASQCQSLSTHEERVECLLTLIAIKSSCGCGTACSGISTSGDDAPWDNGPPPELNPPVKPPKKDTKKKR